MRLVDHVRITPSARSKKPARTSAETGFYSFRNGANRVAFQSSIERGFVQLCDFANEVRHISWEPFSIDFRDLVDNRTRVYTPDYLVEINDREGQRYRYIVEVKERREADHIAAAGSASAAGRAHIAMMRWCREQTDCSFLLVTDEKLIEKGLPNAKAILDRASHRPERSLLDLILSGRLGEFPATLGSVIANAERYAYERGEIISAALHACAIDELWFDITRTWDEEAILRRGSRRRVFLR